MTGLENLSTHFSKPFSPLQVLRPFLEQSKYCNLLPLFVGHNLLLVSNEPKVKEMVRILKGVPFLPLLGKQGPQQPWGAQVSSMPSGMDLGGKILKPLKSSHGAQEPIQVEILKYL